MPGSFYHMDDVSVYLGRQKEKGEGPRSNERQALHLEQWTMIGEGLGTRLLLCLFWHYVLVSVLLCVCMCVSMCVCVCVCVCEHVVLCMLVCVLVFKWLCAHVHVCAVDECVNGPYICTCTHTMETILYLATMELMLPPCFSIWGCDEHSSSNLAI